MAKGASAVSPDPSHPLFKIIAIAALTVFLLALAAILVEKACKAPRTAARILTMHCHCGLPPPGH